MIEKDKNMIYNKSRKSIILQNMVKTKDKNKKEEQMKMKKQKGITLIALVITIIILMILAGVSINLVLGKNGTVPKAKNAKKDYIEAKIEENEQMSTALNIIEEATQGGTKQEETIIQPTPENPQPLAKTVKIGDYVAYDPTEGVTDTTKLTYTSPVGTGTSHGNGSDEQVFSAKAYGTDAYQKWKVFSKNESTGEVVLISEYGVFSDTIMSGSGQFKIGGAIGYLYYEQELANICAIYGYGKGADTTKQFTYQVGNPLVDTLKTETISGSGARSITIEDINKAINHTETEKTEVKFGEGYQPTITTESASTTERKTITTNVATDYYYVKDIIDTSDPMYTILKANPFWIDSRIYINSNSTLIYGTYAMGNGGFMGQSNFCSAGFGSLYSYSAFRNPVKPIVYLKTTLKTSGKDANNAWILVDE